MFWNSLSSEFHFLFLLGNNGNPKCKKREWLSLNRLNRLLLST